MPRGEAEPLLRERVLGRAAPLLLDLAQPVRAALPQRRQGRGVLGVALAQVARGLAALLVDGRAGAAQRVDATVARRGVLALERRGGAPRLRLRMLRGVLGAADVVGRAPEAGLGLARERSCARRRRSRRRARSDSNRM